ncbi:hypothetical protein [Kitasatospora sp. NPDC057500]|uniref:hypothetical protein n=1 Tax=Kitasatospora sp. NPDC057500 TaxID=3346151 RepID=UPI0036895ADB
MAERRRSRIVWWLRGLALLAVLVYLPGLHASRSGGLVEVQRLLDHPVALLGSAVALTVASMVIGFEFRTRRSRVGCAALLMPLVAAGAAVVFMASLFGGDGRAVERKAAPDRPDHVLTVTDTAFSIDPVHHVELLTGTGWSARHWDLGEWDESDPRGYFESAEWTGPHRITVTTDRTVTVYAVDPATGRPSVAQG